MAGTKIDGLASGFDTTAIINSILDAQRIPVKRLEARIGEETNKKTAFLDLSSKLLAAQTYVHKLSLGSTFSQTKAVSSNPDVLSATALTSSSFNGSFQFTVNRLATADQFLSKGFASKTQTLGAGNLTVEIGKGSLKRDTDLGSLNGGAGVEQGFLKITDKTGTVAQVDLRHALTVDDVMTAINAADTQVTASVNASGNGILLTDTSGGAGNLRVDEVSGKTTAADLGLAGVTAGTTLGASADLARLTGATQLSDLNDGRGIRRGAGSDLKITLSDGATIIGVELDGAETVQDVIDAVNAADPNLTASIAPDQKRLVITDSLGGGNPITIQNGDLSRAAEDLGVTNAAARAVTPSSIEGRRIVSGINTVLLTSLNGGTGVAKGSISVTDRSGNNAVVDLSGAETLQEAVTAINNNGTANVRAVIGTGGSNLVLEDKTGATTGNLIISESGSTTALDLGLENGAGIAKTAQKGRNLQFQYITENTATSELNGGNGVAKASIKITDKNGATYNVSLAEDNNNHLKGILDDINGATGGAVVASINATGDGLLLTDTTGGTGTFKVEEIGNSTTAADLRIKGESTGTTINGSYEHAVALDADDTLEDLQSKINSLGIGLTATIINDGSAGAPYRLNLVNSNTGSAGRLTIDAGALDIDFTQTARGLDAVVLYGDTSVNGEPLLIRSSKNTLSDAVPGLTMDLLQASTTPVTVTVSNDTAGLAGQAKGMVDSLNNVIKAVKDLTFFDSEAGKKGLLLGDSLLRNIEFSINRQFTSPIAGLDGSFKTIAQLGVRVTEAGTFTFDESTFNKAVSDDYEGVKEFFTKVEKTGEGADATFQHIGFAAKFDDTLETLTGVFDGTITNKTKGIDQNIDNFKQTIEDKNKRISQLEERLILQFANLETVMSESQNTLARLQAQLGNLISTSKRK